MRRRSCELWLETSWYLHFFDCNVERFFLQARFTVPSWKTYSLVHCNIDNDVKRVQVADITTSLGAIPWAFRPLDHFWHDPRLVSMSMSLFMATWAKDKSMVSSITQSACETTHNLPCLDFLTHYPQPNAVDTVAAIESALSAGAATKVNSLHSAIVS